MAVSFSRSRRVRMPVRAKKSGSKQDRYQHVETLAQGKLPVGYAGKTYAREKGPKERMDTDFVRGRCGEQRSSDHYAQ